MLPHALIVIVITVVILLSDVIVWLLFCKNKLYIVIINRKKLENYDNNCNNDGEEQYMKFMKLNYGLKQVLNIDDLHSKEQY